MIYYNLFKLTSYDNFHQSMCYGCIELAEDDGGCGDAVNTILLPHIAKLYGVYDGHTTPHAHTNVAFAPYNHQKW